MWNLCRGIPRRRFRSCSSYTLGQKASHLLRVSCEDATLARGAEDRVWHSVKLKPAKGEHARDIDRFQVADVKLLTKRVLMPDHGVIWLQCAVCG
uniref:Uncharacterized protein n=1 Tax=Steinernema glaseri TaxID=37863 RepID=A0A1I7YA07_9BILA